MGTPGDDDAMVMGLDTGALDDLNLDDMMFGEGGDDLFGDLDIDLGGMDDIPKDEEEEEEEPPPPPPPPAPKPKRKAKRKQKASWDEETTAKNGDTVKPPKAKKKRTSKAAASSTTKTTTTKRTTKKKASSASATTAKTKDGATVTKKTKKSSGPSSRMVLPMAAQVGQFAGRSNSTTTTTKKSSSTAATTTTTKTTKTTKKKKKSVAAAGSAAGPSSSSQTETKKKGASMLSPNSAGANLASVSADAALSGAPHKSSFPPKQEPRHCGLEVSETKYYPFLPGLPPEATMKSRKSYPIMDKVSSSYASAMSTISPNDVPPGMAESPIYKLLLETYEMSEKDKAAFGAAKRAQLQRCVHEMRGTIGNLEKGKLVNDLFALCQLLQRQHDFLQQNLDNMQNWCKKNFLPLDYQLTYHADNSGTKLRTSTTGKPVSPNFLSMRTPFLRIRVVCAGFQPPPPTHHGVATHPGTLIAQLPVNILDLIGPEEEKRRATVAAEMKAAKAAAAKVSTTKKPAPKIKAAPKTKKSAATDKVKASASATAPSSSATTSKASAASTPAASSAQASAVTTHPAATTAPAAPPAPEKPAPRQPKMLSYTETHPLDRRQRIWEYIQNRAAQLEAKYITLRDARDKIVQRKADQAASSMMSHDIEDDALPLHTKAAWNYLDKISYHTYGLNEIDQLLQPFWSAYVNPCVKQGNVTVIGRKFGHSEMAQLVEAAEATAMSKAEQEETGTSSKENDPVAKMEIDADVEAGKVKSIGISTDADAKDGENHSTTKTTASSSSTTTTTMAEGTKDAHPGMDATVDKNMLVHKTVDLEQFATPTHTSLVDRLQSLLVEEEDSDLENGGTQYSDGSDIDSDSDSELDVSEWIEEDPSKNTRLVDVSAFSMEERLFMHLGNIGLVKRPLYPEPEFTLRRAPVVYDEGKEGHDDDDGVEETDKAGAAANNVEGKDPYRTLDKASVKMNGHAGGAASKYDDPMQVESNGDAAKKQSKGAKPATNSTVASTKKKHAARRDPSQIRHESADSVADVLAAMANDLERTTRMNNGRLFFVQNSARRYWKACQDSKKRRGDIDSKTERSKGIKS